MPRVCRGGQDRSGEECDRSTENDVTHGGRPTLITRGQLEQVQAVPGSE